MKTRPRFNLSLAVMKLFLMLGVVWLLLLGSPALAVPIAVDVYQDMESGNAGDVLTASIMNASNHGAGGWSANAGTMWVSTLYHRDLPSPVIVAGVTYNGTGGTRSWVFNNNLLNNCVRLGLADHKEVTMACYYTTLTTIVNQQVGYDTLIMWGGSTFACMQTLGGAVVRPHSKTDDGISTGSPSSIPLSTGKTYWINMKYDGSVRQVVQSVYDPDNSYSQVGTLLVSLSTFNDNLGHAMDFGRGDNHGNQAGETTQSYFTHIMIDYTNAAYPLLPSGANDGTAPGAPLAVRDGNGADQSIALSTTQLSANWDDAVDNESGIKGYQYAIGTSQGGTNVTNWTTLINQRGVTKTGLSLTTGQTYYFSVKAINGVGLTGAAANSNGQTVGTDATAPGAPAAVRDVYGPWNFGPQPDVDENPSYPGLYGNWDPATDNESGISFYQYGIGTTPGATDFYGWTYASGNANRATYGSTNLTPGQRYYFTVRAINNAGITGPAANSNGVTIVNTSDTTPPGVPPAVRDGTGTDIATQTSTTQLSANWDNSSDAESGISGYQYAIGTTAGGTNILNFTGIAYAPVNTVTVTGLNLSVGQTYYFSVKAVNGKNLTGSATNSNGVTIGAGGNQPPSAPANVRDGTGSDITYTTSNTQLSANWDASTDPDGSVTAYQYAIGTSAGGTQTVNWTTLGNVTTVTKTGLSLTNGQTYFFSVKAVDNQGLAGSATNSNGQTVDTTAPGAGHCA